MQLSDRIGEGGQLSRLRVLTDAGLSRLDVSELISEVLRRVCDLLDADVAAVMLLDAAGHVVPTAVETGVAALQQSPRSSATRDFSRSVVQSRTASSVVDVGKTDGQAPGHGLVRSSLGVPIFAAAEIVGMYAGTLECLPIVRHALVRAVPPGAQGRAPPDQGRRGRPRLGNQSKSGSSGRTRDGGHGAVDRTGDGARDPYAVARLP